MRSAKQNIASINGKRLNYCSEMQTKEFGANADALKALISGEPFEVRLVYINNFTARNIPLLMGKRQPHPLHERHEPRIVATADNPAV